MSNSFLDNSIGYNLNMGATLIKRELIGQFRQNGFDITPEQWAILARLNEEEGLTQNEVALITFKDNANITRIVDQLEKKGLVQRRKHPDDRRAWLLFITPAGKKRVKGLQQLARKVLNKATKGIDPKNLEAANKTIQAIMTNLM